MSMKNKTKQNIEDIYIEGNNYFIELELHLIIAKIY